MLKRLAILAKRCTAEGTPWTAIPAPSRRIGTPTARPGPARRLGILAGVVVAGLGFHESLDRSINAVIAMNPLQMPVDDLGHRVAVLRVVALQPRHADLEQILIHLRRCSCPG